MLGSLNILHGATDVKQIIQFSSQVKPVFFMEEHVGRQSQGMIFKNNFLLGDFSITCYIFLKRSCLNLQTGLKVSCQEEASVVICLVSWWEQETELGILPTSSRYLCLEVQGHPTFLSIFMESKEVLVHCKLIYFPIDLLMVNGA